MPVWNQEKITTARQQIQSKCCKVYEIKNRNKKKKNKKTTTKKKTKKTLEYIKERSLASAGRTAITGFASTYYFL